MQIESNNMQADRKSLVLYFSATGTTEAIAKKIADASGSDIIEIIPELEYTSDDLNYNNNSSRANNEQNDDSARPGIRNNFSIDTYDTIYLGYPIWWGTIPKIILTALDNYNFDNKTVIPFCTSGSTGISQSVNDLKSYKPNANWLKGKRFSSSATDEEIKSWIKS